MSLVTKYSDIFGNYDEARVLKFADEKILDRRFPVICTFLKGVPKHVREKTINILAAHGWNAMWLDDHKILRIDE